MEMLSVHRNYRTALLTWTSMTVVLCLVVLWREMAFAARIFEESLQYERFFCFALWWLCIPLLNLLQGLWIRTDRSRRLSIALALYFMLWMVLLLLGPEPDEALYEGGHLYTFPIVAIMGTPIVLYVEFCARRIMAKKGAVIQVRNAGDSSPQVR